MSIEVSKLIGAKDLLGYVVLLLVTTLAKFQFFVTIFAHSTTPIDEVWLEPLSPSCRHGVKSTFLLGHTNGLRFCYTRSCSVETRSKTQILCESFKFRDNSNKIISWIWVSHTWQVSLFSREIPRFEECFPISTFLLISSLFWTSRLIL